MAKLIESARVLYLGPSDINDQWTGGKIKPQHIKPIKAFENAEIVIYRYRYDFQLLKSRW